MLNPIKGLNAFVTISKRGIPKNGINTKKPINIFLFLICFSVNSSFNSITLSFSAI